MNATDGDTAMAHCASCGKSGDDLKLKACTACKLVKYCGVACQRAHRPRHKRECRKRAAELRDEALFAEPPPREECPICFLMLPLNVTETMYYPCCGKVVCMGCCLAAGQEGHEKCPFCREWNSGKIGVLEKLKARADKGDAMAIFKLGLHYMDGDFGLQRDSQRAFELRLQAGKLGCADGYNTIAFSYFNGDVVEQDTNKAGHYWELAAMGGHAKSRYILGVEEMEAGNYERAIRHWMIAAGSGEDDSLGSIRNCYSDKLVTKDIFEKALRAHQKSTNEMKSDQRDKAVAYLQL
ncbi:hypothetical protein ACHAWF_006269 [Thalassiosira exigua]